MVEVCPVTKKEVPACSCGPHLECPEHLLNCVIMGDYDYDALTPELQDHVDQLLGEEQPPDTSQRNRSLPES